MLGTTPRKLSIGALLVAAALGAYLLTPRQLTNPAGLTRPLGSLVPLLFADWRPDPEQFAYILPEATASADPGQGLYEQVLNRTYTNSRRQRIMLTIAYGSNQRDTLRVHRPEACYAAQGFAVTQPVNDQLELGVEARQSLPVRRLVASAGPRYEPITYWTIIGRQAVADRADSKLETLRYALSGSIPDGMLVRVSSVSRDEVSAYALQDQFIGDLFAALDATGQREIMGASGSQ
jgi:EpsI family protein